MRNGWYVWLGVVLGVLVPGLDEGCVRSLKGLGEHVTLTLLKHSRSLTLVVAVLGHNLLQLLVLIVDVVNLETIWWDQQPLVHVDDVNVYERILALQTLGMALRLILGGEAPTDLQTQLIILLGHIRTNDRNQCKNLSWNRQEILLERTHLKLQSATLLSDMDQLRKQHNQAKRDLINQWVRPDSYILDCGCGRGGDWHKWKAVRARVAAIDPDEKSLQEAEERALDIGLGVWFLGQGDIRQAAFAGPFDTVCYNFSIQYIIGDHFEHSIKAIKVAVKPGGLLIGITPEKSLIEDTKSPDALGNMFEIHGDKVLMSLTDGPFYADGPKYEPLLDGTVLRQALDPEFRCIAWGPITPVKTGLVTDIYAQFVFLRIE